MTSRPAVQFKINFGLPTNLSHTHFSPLINELWPRLEDHKYRWELHSYFDLKKSAVLDRVWVGAWGQRGLEPRWRSGDPLCGKGADLD